MQKNNKRFTSFHDIPKDAWATVIPEANLTLGDKVLENLNKGFDKVVNADYNWGNWDPYSAGNTACWYTSSADFSRTYTACHATLGGNFPRNPLLFNALVRHGEYLDEIDLYSEYLSSVDNPAFPDLAKSVYLMVNRDDKILGWLWPNLPESPAGQTVFFNIASRDMMEHRNMLVLFNGYYTGIAEGDVRLSWLLSMYFAKYEGYNSKLRAKNALRSYCNVHGIGIGYNADPPGAVPLPFLFGPSPVTGEKRKTWTLFVNEFWKVYDTVENKTPEEFVTRYKELIKTGKVE